MSPIDYSQRGEQGWIGAGYYRDCREAKYIQSWEIANSRYQRDELLSVEACEELKKRTDKQISDAEKKSAIRRKVEQAKAKNESK